MKILLWLLSSVFVTIHIPQYVFAKDVSEKTQKLEIADSVYSKDRISFQSVIGVLSSPWAGSDTDELDYAQLNLRLGWMLTDPSETPSFLRGNFEAILEITNSIIYEGKGDYFSGIAAHLRYNFIQPEANLVPYINAGVGIIYNDMYKDRTQEAIGQAVEFTMQSSLGFRYHLSERWSFDAEFIAQHISNGDMARRNDGINAWGGFLGVTYFFRR